MLGASRRKEGAELVDYLTRFHFLAEIEHQAGLGLLAAQDLEQSVAADDKERVWYSAQAFLVATAIVSKLLWGGPSDAPKRAHLRECLGVSDDSPLRSQVLRNHFEHFDERIEKWAHRGQGSADLVIGVPWQANPDEDWRYFDPSSRTLSFTGDKLDLALVVGALSKVKAAAELQQPPLMPPQASPPD